MSVQLSQEQYDKLRAADDKIKLVRENLNRAERAGMPMPELKAELDKLSKLRQGLLREFAPGANPKQVNR